MKIARRSSGRQQRQIKKVLIALPGSYNSIQRCRNTKPLISVQKYKSESNFLTAQKIVCFSYSRTGRSTKWKVGNWKALQNAAKKKIISTRACRCVHAGRELIPTNLSWRREKRKMWKNKQTVGRFFTRRRSSRAIHNGIFEFFRRKIINFHSREIFSSCAAR